MSLGRRSFCTLIGAGALTATVAPYAAAEGRTGVRFTLGAEVLDGGQQITSLALDLRGMGRIDPAGLDADTFTVHATGTSPVPIEDGEVIFSEYDEDRIVGGVTVDRRGTIMIDLEHGFEAPAANTLAWVRNAARNVTLDLTYTITQNAPLRRMDGGSVTLPSFRQGGVTDPEVDRFDAGSTAGIEYRIAPPRPGSRRGRPGLVLWLHGNGEGGLGEYRNNASQLLANRGALGPATAEAQEILGGAYVVAPQVPDTWYEVDQQDYANRIKALIDEVIARHGIDARRVWVMGASAGGFMTVQLVSHFPDFFAAAVPTCPAIYLPNTGYLVSEQQVRAMADTPTWFVHAENDGTVPYEPTSVWAHDLLPDSILTSYPDVTWDGNSYNGHFSWIYTARNDPQHNGESLWSWMARQRR